MKARKTARNKGYKFEDYLNRERETHQKHEYRDGKLLALAGGTLNHGKICGNVYAETRAKLREKGADCMPFNSDVKLHIKKANAYVYPDTMVVCSEIEASDNNGNAVCNPVLIIEVLSKSTADYDRGDKFYMYRKIPTFKEYVLIEQHKYVVDVHFKAEGVDLWQIKRYEGEHQVIKLQSLGIALSMKELYDSVIIEEA